MTSTDLVPLLMTYKYSVLFPVALIEGHVISLIAGFLARLGYLNPFFAAGIIICGNLTGDIILYWLGHYHGEYFFKRWGRYVGITEETIAQGRELLHTRHAWILFLSKLANGFGLAMAILFAAGTARIPFRAYLLWNFLGECIWTSTLVTLGFIFGQFYVSVENLMFRVGLMAISLVLCGVLWKMRRRFTKKILGY